MIIESLKNLAVAIDSLQGLPGNPRLGDVDAVAKSLERFGQRKPIVVRKDDGTIIAGNHTWQAAKKLGWKEIAVAYVGDDDTTAQAYALADNRTAELGSYDEEALKDLIDKVAAVDPDLVRTSGWSDDAVRDLVNKIESELPKDFNEDKVPEPPIEAKTKIGNIYQLGNHKLMCGDSTDEASVFRLINDVKIDMVLTDPPYNIDYSGLTNKFDKIKNDKMSDDNFTNFLMKALKIESDTYYVFCSWQYNHLFRNAMENIGKPVKAFIIWNKINPAQNLDKYYKAHEIILYSGKFGGQKTLRSDVWEHKRERNTEHPTMKPVTLLAMALDDNPEARTIYDAFGGSGSTLIACEQMKRSAYIMELDPKYCDVIIQRWENLTGEKAVLVNAKSA